MTCTFGFILYLFTLLNVLLVRGLYTVQYLVALPFKCLNLTQMLIAAFNK